MFHVRLRVLPAPRSAVPSIFSTANNGSLAATGVTVVDTIPADFTYKSIGSIGNPAVPPTSVTGVTQGPGTVTFSVNDLADGGTASFFVTFFKKKIHKAFFL